MDNLGFLTRYCPAAADASGHNVSSVDPIFAESLPARPPYKWIHPFARSRFHRSTFWETQNKEWNKIITLGNGIDFYFFKLNYSIIIRSQIKFRLVFPVIESAYAQLTSPVIIITRERGNNKHPYVGIYTSRELYSAVSSSFFSAFFLFSWNNLTNVTYGIKYSSKYLYLSKRPQMVLFFCGCDCKLNRRHRYTQSNQNPTF